MFLRTDSGYIVETPKKKPIKGLFCTHEHVEVGTECSESGYQRISGIDRYKVCMGCGKILGEYHKEFRRERLNRETRSKITVGKAEIMNTQLHKSLEINDGRVTGVIKEF